MARLTRNQLAFLRQHDVPLARVFDATGRSNKDYRQAMSALKLWVAYGVVPCRTAGHTLRDRAGHCVQCKPANLSYQRRHDENGEVYVARSVYGCLIKVGAALNAKKRISQLNVYTYGGYSDWESHFVAKTSRAGKVEARAHRALSKHSARGTYLKNGRNIECQELFACSKAVAIAAVKEALKKAI